MTDRRQYLDNSVFVDLGSVCALPRRDMWNVLLNDQVKKTKPAVRFPSATFISGIW